eukprot:2488318-Amphidinium_carterae.1
MNNTGHPYITHRRELEATESMREDSRKITAVLKKGGSKVCGRFLRDHVRPRIYRRCQKFDVLRARCLAQSQ